MKIIRKLNSFIRALKGSSGKPRYVRNVLTYELNNNRRRYSTAAPTGRTRIGVTYRADMDMDVAAKSH